MPEEKTFSISADPEGFTRLVFVNSDTPERFEEFKLFGQKIVDTITETYGQTHEKVRTLVDLTYLTKYSPRSIAALVDVLNKTQQHTLKTATFGARPDILLAQKAVTALAGRDNIRAFKTEHEAKMWLLAKH
jgi:hypothetical protein